MKKKNDLYSRNLQLARTVFSVERQEILLKSLQYLSAMNFDIGSGDLVLLDKHWYVTHTGLVRMAKRKRCSGIEVEPVGSLCDFSAGRYVFKATVYISKCSSGFVGYGDADPSNVSSLVKGAEMRVAETRAVNRALRKAYGIGICSVDELGAFPIGTGKAPSQPEKLHSQSHNGHVNGGSRVRDRLCQLIRQYKLDPELVKAYAVDFCGAKTLRDATREQVGNFVLRLADSADKDRNALLCQLNSYVRPKQEVVA